MALAQKSPQLLDCDVFLVGKCEKEISGAKLPSKRQVLQVLFHHIRIENMNLNPSARLVAHEVLEYWKKARVPTITAENCVKKLKKLYDEWRDVQRNKRYQQRADKFKDELDMLFDVARLDALQIMTNAEDKELLLKQREPRRPGSTMAIELNLATEEQRQMQRMGAVQRRNQLTQEAGITQYYTQMNDCS